MPVSALHHHSVPIAQAAMARRAIDIEALLAAKHHVLRNRHGKLGDVLSVRILAGIKRGVLIEVSARYRPFRYQARRRTVREESARPQRNIFRLVMHVLAT